MDTSSWDIFISYAKEDRAFATSLVQALQRRGLTVWFDELILLPGDSIRRSIDLGLSESRFAIVIISNSSLVKEWPRRELDALLSREQGTRKIIIPIWHNVDKEQLLQLAPLMADKLAIRSNDGLNAVVDSVLRTVFSEQLKIENWKPYSFPWPDGTTMVVVPVQPRNNQAICIGKYPVTNDQYRAFVNDSPNHLDEGGGEAPLGKRFEPLGKESRWHSEFMPWIDTEFRNASQPVVCVAHSNAVDYYRWVNRKMEKDSKRGEIYGYTALPTPALWDFVAFGTEYPSRNPGLWLSQMDSSNSEGQSHPVPIGGSRCPSNAIGVADLFGTVWQWCDARRRIPARPIPAPSGLWYPLTLDVNGIELRGGSYLDDLRYVEPFRSLAQLPDRARTSLADIGFRIAATVPLTILPQGIQEKLKLSRPCSEHLWIRRFRGTAYWEEQS